jgi:hypothetical protein
MRTLLSQDATLRISAVGENATSEMESSGPWGTWMSPDTSTVAGWAVAALVAAVNRDMMMVFVVVRAEQSCVLFTYVTRQFFFPSERVVHCATAMHTTVQRLNSISSLLTTVLFVLGACIAITSFLIPTNPSSSVHISNFRVYRALPPVVQLLMTERTGGHPGVRAERLSMRSSISI